MIKYVCRKPCKFGDKNYVIGEQIDSELIAPDRVPALIKYGTITAEETPDEPVKRRTKGAHE